MSDAFGMPTPPPWPLLPSKIPPWPDDDPASPGFWDDIDGTGALYLEVLRERSPFSFFVPEPRQIIDQLRASLESGGDGVSRLILQVSRLSALAAVRSIEVEPVSDGFVGEKRIVSGETEARTLTSGLIGTLLALIDIVLAEKAGDQEEFLAEQDAMWRRLETLANGMLSAVELSNPLIGALIGEAISAALAALSDTTADLDDLRARIRALRRQYQTVVRGVSTGVFLHFDRDPASLDGFGMPTGELVTIETPFVRSLSASFEAWVLLGWSDELLRNGFADTPLP